MFSPGPWRTDPEVDHEMVIDANLTDAREGRAA